MKRQEIELLRIICAFGIVWYHSGVAFANEFSYSSLIVFVIISAYFSSPDRLKLDMLSAIRKRASRLLIPFFAWYLVFSVFNIIRNKPYVPVEYGAVEMLLVGPSIHLWYVPFVFFSLLAVDFIAIFLPKNFFSVVCAVLASVFLLLAPLWRPGSLLLGEPLAQYAHALAAVFVGVAYRGLVDMKTSQAMLMVLMLFASSLFAYEVPGVGIPYSIAILVGLLLPIGNRFVRFDIDFSKLSSLMFGVYFIHVAFLGVFKKIPHGPVELVPVVSFVASILLIYLLRNLVPRFAHFWM